MENTDLFAEFEPIATKDWLAKIEKDLKGKPIDGLNWEVDEGLTMKPFYRAEDMGDLPDLARKTSDNDWYIQEEIEVEDGIAAIKRANKRALQILTQGATSLLFVLDNVISEKDFFALMKGIHPQMVSLNFGGLFTESEPGTVLEYFKSFLKKNKTKKTAAHGGVWVDPVGFFVDTGEYYETYEEDMMEVEGAILAAAHALPNFCVINVDTTSFHNQGTQAAQELAIALSIGSEYLTRLTEFELEADTVMRHMQFTFCAASSYFVEIAKLRAFRLLWREVRKAYGITTTSPVRIHAKTSLRTQTDDQHTNMIHATTEAMSGILGGADLLTVQPADLVHGVPDDFTRRIARNVQHILQHESHLNRVADPATGSYYIETLTQKLAQVAWEKFQKIESAGGILVFMGSE